ncbi:hypothetical protein [Sphingomonas yantingensis]|uniref:Uncharacterized protein n=1 Tax=Sphingomonas yantingensis TaxID=1241761 RepID=A0A7W9AQ07_9SPHN|nr:hypothetical protein [Sphingomonas yantingensis]MBB5698508.1 hypothetical protein [Sphingomonas yantingensis]
MTSSIVTHVERNAPHIIRSLKDFHRLPFDLSRFSIEDLVVFMYALIRTSTLDADGLYEKVVENRGSIRRETFNFILDTFDGDDPQFHLWRCEMGEFYIPLPEDMFDMSEERPGHRHYRYAGE